MRVDVSDMSVCLYGWLYVFLSACMPMPVCLPVCLSVYLYACMSVCIILYRIVL